MKAGKKPDYAPKLLFKDEKAWAAWLEKNHQSSVGVWMRVAKKGSGLESVSYPEALEVAICYGWIDGQKRPENGSRVVRGVNHMDVARSMGTQR